jgi:hypothetical protein
MEEWEAEGLEFLPHPEDVGPSGRFLLMMTDKEDNVIEWTFANSHDAAEFFEFAFETMKGSFH